jgi:hypothetical protein
MPLPDVAVLQTLATSSQHGTKWLYQSFLKHHQQALFFLKSWLGFIKYTAHLNLNKEGGHEAGQRCLDELCESHYRLPADTAAHHGATHLCAASAINVVLLHQCLLATVTNLKGKPAE